MTYETYDSLMRVFEKRIRRAMITGSAHDLHEASMEKERLMSEWQRENYTNKSDNKLQ